ncbi:sortase domain-bontaining protein [Arthrobacter flavus]|uniref:Sortase domain-bontaining protein n=1 Tax=Arthrobacter flavus TaxID=95172 RepID=A0ABW4Q3A6_9MICC
MTQGQSPSRPLSVSRHHYGNRLVYALLGAVLILLTACSGGGTPPAGSTPQPSSGQSASAPASNSGPSVTAPPGDSRSPVEVSPTPSGLAGVEPGDITAPVAVGVSAPTHLTVPAAGIDMEILGLTPTEGEITSQSIVPPFTLDAYWLTTYGSPGEGSTNTTYITGHSWEDREAPFNRLSSDVAVGDALTVGIGTGALEYVVESVTTHDKDTLKTSDIWDIVPHRLVLISCYTDDLWGKNVIVTAVPVG